MAVETAYIIYLCDCALSKLSKAVVSLLIV